MPYYETSAYRPRFPFTKGHFSTLYAGVFKRVRVPLYRRKELSLPDGDFLEVDYRLRSCSRAVIICHGLEGDSTSNYNNSLAQYALNNGYSVFAWNNRSCGSRMNRLPKLYHHASVDDLDAVVQDVLQQGFDAVYLAGFSLGGAQIMNYFGRRHIDARIKAGVAVSTPIQLKASAHKIDRGLGKLYQKRFVQRIKRKIGLKARKFPELLDEQRINAIDSFEDIAENFMVPVHGFADLEAYYKEASPGSSMGAIKTPVLLLNAVDDPILGEFARPVERAETHKCLYLETPRHGGHCGFRLPKTDISYAAIRAVSFFEMFF